MDPKELITVKTFDQLIEASITRLKNLGFRITNFNPGGVFRTLLEECHQAAADLYNLFQNTLMQFFVDSATGTWLDYKAADVTVFRKAAVKTKGNVVMGRSVATNAVTIPAGKIIRTDMDSSGKELRYFVTTDTILAAGTLEGPVPVEAEFAGASYNAGTNQITTLVTYIAGIDYVRNDADWITQEGSDEEIDDALRIRTKDRWNQLSLGATALAYISWAKEVTGVVEAMVDSDQPRGAGTVDVVIIGTAGVPSQALLDSVQSKLDEKKSLIADVLAVAPSAVNIDINVTVTVHPIYGDLTVISNEVDAILTYIFNYGDTTRPTISKVDPTRGLTRAQIISNLMSITNVINVTVTAPAADVTATVRQLLVKGTVTKTVQRAV